MTEPDEQQTQMTTYVPLAEAVLIFQAAGVYRSERTISRYCENAALDCFKEQLPSGAMGYFINREAIQDRIIELKQLAASGHGAPGRDVSGHDTTGQDMSRHDATEMKILRERVEKAEKERDEVRDDNMQLKIDVGVRKALLNEAKKLTDQMLGERDGMMRYVGALEGQVRQLGAAPVDPMSLASPTHAETTKETPRAKTTEPETLREEVDSSSAPQSHML